jgi:HlyD family secretion protein
LDLERVSQLAKTDIASKEAQDNARLALDTARAQLQEAGGAYDFAKAYLDWCIIRSPINGVVLEKLVDPNELVAPQSFGGTRGPSTALIAMADPKDLQVEIDLNEADLSKISLNQKCRVSPEAYPDKSYEGYVAEVAPEANRAKGTLQIKVQIREPDKFLTPELSAKVEFLK